MLSLIHICQPARRRLVGQAQPALAIDLLGRERFALAVEVADGFAHGPASVRSRRPGATAKRSPVDGRHRQPPDRCV